MAAIDPKGLFNGQRIGACSDKAQLYWPRLFVAGNNFGRLELHFPTLIERCFHSFREPPSESDLKDIIAEYIENFLAFPYPADGRVWLQFATEDKWLRHKKNTADLESPAPPADFRAQFDAGYAEWKQKKAAQNGEDSLVAEMFPRFFGNLPEKSPTTGSPKSSTAVGIRQLAVGSRKLGVGITHTSLADVVSVQPPPTTTTDGIPTITLLSIEEDKPPDYGKLWNSHCAPLAPIRELTRKRADRLRVLEKAGLTPPRFLAAIAKLKMSPFCMGEGPNHWKASFDFLIDGDNLVRVLEGVYDKPTRKVILRAESYKDLAHDVEERKTS